MPKFVDTVKKGLQRFAIAGGLALGTLPIFSQNHDLDFKVRELTNGTGANIAGVQIELDDGKYLGVTDANGVAHIHDVVDGTHRIKIAKEGYIQFLQDGYELSNNQNFNASIIKKNQVGAWGNVDFNVSWFRQTFATIGEYMWNKEPLKWARVAPVNNMISATPVYTQQDSINIVAAINEIEAKTGLDLINLVENTASVDTMYTLYNYSTNVSRVYSLNGIIYKGYSKFSVSTPTKRVIHEILQQFDMWPISSTAYVSVMEPDTYIMADMQPYDANHLFIAVQEARAKQRGEQDLFLGNMMEYVTPTTPVATAVTSPIDGTTGLEALVRFIYNNSPGTNKYHMDIATDVGFTNMVRDLLVYRTDTAILLSNDQQYYVRVRAENVAGNSAWSSTVGFHTAALPPLPGSTGISIPVNNATKVTIPVQYTLIQATDATEYNILVALDASYTNIVKDTLVGILTPTIPLTNGTVFYTKARGKNPTGYGPFTGTTIFTTIKATPGIAGIGSPLNNATKVEKPTPFTLIETINAENYQLQIATDNLFNNIVKDTALTNLTPTIPQLENGNTYYARVRARNTDVNGTWSGTTMFTMIKSQPTVAGIGTPLDNATKVPTPVQHSIVSALYAEDYELMIATDNLFNNILKDTTLTNLTPNIPLPNGVTVYARVRGKNSDQNGDWSPIIKYTTIKGTPGIAGILNPLNNATKVPIPVHHNLFSAINSEDYQMQFASDIVFSNILKDTILTNLNPNIPLQNNTTIYARVRGRNTDVNGQWSTIIKYTTIKATPGTTEITLPLDNATKVPTPVQYTLLTVPNAETYQILVASDNAFNTLLKDTVLTNLNPLIPLQKGITVYTKARARNSDVDGAWSAVKQYTIDTATGIENVVKKNHKIYPNPAENQFTIEFDDYKERNIKIYSLDGKLQKQMIIYDRQKVIDVSDMKSQMYIINVLEGNNKNSDKLIKK